MKLMPSLLPSAKEILNEAIKNNASADVNELHEETYELMLKYRRKYYQQRVDSLLSKIDIGEEAKKKVRAEILKPIVVKDVEYSNMMEEASRRVSQTFQPLSGKLAELCAEREIQKVGLKHKTHYLKNVERTDFMIYHPDKATTKKRHRVEVKNVKSRERATRGLAFDGDSLFGFFNDPDEFTFSNVKIFNEHCSKTGGYCYIPPDTLKKISFQKTLNGATHRFKSNTTFAIDMLNFVKKGVI